MDEQWKPIAGWEEFYEVSSLGRVKSLARVVTLANRWGGFNERRLPARIMSQVEFMGRYWQVSLKADGRRTSEYVHRLVCAAFCGTPDEGQTQVAHWDGDGFNNHYTNLRWVTPGENAEDAIRLGRTNKGEKHPLSILTFEIVQDIRKNGTVETDAETARRFGVKKRTVANIRLGRKWKWVGND